MLSMIGILVTAAILFFVLKQAGLTGMAIPIVSSTLLIGFISIGLGAIFTPVIAVLIGVLVGLFVFVKMIGFFNPANKKCD